jgi:hypothetical protein
MVRRSWLECVESELARRRVPAGRRSRLLAELRDHLEDLTEGGNRMSEIEWNDVLGSPEALAERAATEYRKESWIRRHPLCVFGFTPLPAALLGLALYVLLTFGISWLLDLCFGELSVSGFFHERLGRSIVTAYTYTVGLVPFAACAALFGWLTVRSKVNRRWLVVAVAQVGIVAWMVVASATFSDVPGQSQIMIGLRLPPWNNLNRWASLLSPGLLQLALPIAVGMIYLRAGARRVGV